MSAPATETKPDFDGEFLQTLDAWREKNKIRDDDAIYLLVELFRIHQNHWDELRRRQMPSLDQFRSEIGDATESARSLSEKLQEVIEILAVQPGAAPIKTIPRSEAVFATSAAILSGLLIGLFLGKFLL
jgi:hypothetical protein